MTSGRTASEMQRSAAETADERARLRADIDRRIQPEEFDRYKARAARLRAEAITHLLRRFKPRSRWIAGARPRPSSSPPMPWRANR